MKKITFALSLIMALFLSGCTSESPEGLNDHFKDSFTIGAAVMPHSLRGPEAELLKKEFGSLTAENVMKPGPIHPEENRYFWDDADSIVNFAMANGMKVRGHTLCWHSQIGNWMLKDSLGNLVSKELALERLKNHITTVVSRYKGKVYAWDVVNEVIKDDTTGIYRESNWYKICGPEFIAKAFQYAHDADPEAKLFYNDYNSENPLKRDKIFNMVKGFIDSGVPIHGIGLQGHWNLTEPTEQNLRDALDKYKSLGVDLQITELDISVYQRGDTIPANYGFTPEREQKQIEQYKMAFKVFQEYKDAITGVTFWNISDKSSWLDNRPRGRKNYPLLFDQNLQPKKAYLEVVKL